MDNRHERKFEVKLKECGVETDPNLNRLWYNKAFCVQPAYHYMMGNYGSDRVRSQLLQVSAIRCDKSNDIFKNVPYCASDSELRSFLKANVFMYIDDNVIDYDSTMSNKDGRNFFRKRKTVYYNHVQYDLGPGPYKSYESYLITLHMNKIEIMDQGLISKNLTNRQFLSVQDINKVSYYAGQEVASKGVLFESIFTLSNEGVFHQVK